MPFVQIWKTLCSTNHCAKPPMKTKTKLSNLSDVHVLAVGDIMLDRFEHGSVERISPEAPVPVFRPLREKSMLGGVGNVAANLTALGCAVDLVARIGKDKEGKTLSRMAMSIGVNTYFLSQPEVATIVKTRLIAGNNHLLRIDTEDIRELDDKLADQTVDTCLDIIDNADVILLSDYAKGFLTKRLCQNLIATCKKHGKKVIVDPKGTDYTKYKGAFLVKPNLKELKLATGESFSPSSPHFLKDVAMAANSLARKIGVGGILVTLSEHGMLYVPASQKTKPLHLPTIAKEVFDVSGAGDTALATLGAALGAGCEMSEAMEIANAASSVVVSKLGTATATLDEIGSALSKTSSRTAERKIVSLDAIANIAKKLRQDGKVIGFTNGCFDCCHLGHLQSLHDAKALCDILIVGANSDEWIRKHKGADRPIQDQRTRTTLLAALEYVDYVVVFSDKTALPLVRQIRPDIIAKEGYALKDWPEGKFVRSIGGKAVTLKRVDGYSTTEIANKLKCK